MEQVEKLFSFTLYGSNPLYIQGAINNAIQIPKIFDSSYKVRFYVMDISLETINKLRSLNAEVIEMKNHPNNQMKDYKFFRFLAVKKDNIVFFRDCDSIVSYREKIMINEFLASNKKLHIIRDHPNHKEHIMAGLFGFNKCGIPTDLMIELINQSNLKDINKYNVDQLFLAKFIYPLFTKDILIHDNFNNFYREKDEIILKHPRSHTYLGQVIRDNISDDEKRFESYKGYIMFNKTRFSTMYELIETFIHYLSVSRYLKRTLIFMEFYVHAEKVLLEDYIQIDEINRYTLFKRSYNILEFKETHINQNDTIVNLQNNNSELLVISNETIITTNTDYDDFTLHNVIQLNDKLNYKVEEYLLEHNLDRQNVIINHTDQTINLENIINIKDLYNTIDENNITNMTKEILRLFSGIYRIHVNPPELIQKFSKRYWHHWDDDFKVITDL
jgi:hypothetical protein